MRILITAGGTREYIDPVRFITNASSGKMGYALAQAALKTGHKVTLITAPTNLNPPKGAKLINVETGAQMFTAVKKHFPKCDCLIMAAAVSDYAPAKTSKTKIKKSAKPLLITLKPAVDILKWAGQHKKNQILAGFALEDRNLKARALTKLRQKKLDMIIANKPSSIGADTTSCYVFFASNVSKRLPRLAKSAMAQRIIKLIAAL